MFFPSLFRLSRFHVRARAAFWARICTILFCMDYMDYGFLSSLTTDGKPPNAAWKMDLGYELCMYVCYELGGRDRGVGGISSFFLA